ncbi:MAG: hypothetical protein SFV52_03240 [Saprospiraceae bacterium]|nr:hypothetical protein [Saprospiraceae bacterium]
MSRQYQIIRRVRYERNLLDLARAFSADGQPITLDGIQQIYQKAQDGYRITDTERRTLLYIGAQFSLDPDAQAWLRAQFQSPDPDNPYEAILKRVIREEYRLMNLGWQVDPAEVRRQEDLGQPRLFENALRGALKAFLNWNMGQLSFGAFVNRFHDNETYPTPEALLRAHLDRGTLFLVPLDRQQSPLAHDVPDGLDTVQHWVFGLHVPKFFPALFLAHMRRDQADQQYSNGYISRKPPLTDLMPDTIGRLLDNPGLAASIDPDEVSRQLAYLPGQNFGNALFAALHGGIYNGESSMSLRDFIQQEIWPDPERDLREYIRDYLNEGGKISLLPADFRDGNAFGIPPDMIYWDEKEWWLFVVEMPQRTHIKAIINTPRDNQDGETAWNDCFQPADNRPLAERLRDVLTQEFDLPALQLLFPESEYEAQRTQFGPDWRHPQGLLRQALNTILHDYLEPRSVFHIVTQVHNMHPGDYPGPRAFRDAVRTRIHGYLQTATLELLPIERPDNNPVDTEPIDRFWEFFLLLPGLSDHGFWVIIPRWPEEGQRPYVYGVN